jgi:predicted Zn-dependent protease with MMP-like domain
MSRSELEEVAADAIDQIPPALLELIDNVVIQVEDEPDQATMRELGLDPRTDTLLGLYTGIPLDVRGDGYGAVLPDVIQLYRRPLLESCSSRDELIHEIQLTVLHELGHHFGLTDDEMDAWEHELDAPAEEP